jgi:4-hydroxy-tetrahydrodipicolinate synthase
MKCEGCFTPLVTPFNHDGSIDKGALDHLLERQVEARIDGIVVLGTTAETPTLSDEEQQFIVKRSIEISSGQTKIVVGTGSYSTDAAVKKTKEAKTLGADACLVVFPYYNRPTAEGVRRHFEEIAKVGLPIILYNHPGRTGLRLNAKEILSLLEIPEVIGLKDSSGDIDLWVELIETCHKSILTGDDLQTPSLAALGGGGVISILANLFPKEWKEMTSLCLRGDFVSARSILYRFAPICRAMVLETNPQCVKYALSVLGYCQSTMRLPLIEPKVHVQAKIQALMQEFFAAREKSFAEPSSALALG